MSVMMPVARAHTEQEFRQPKIELAFRSSAFGQTSSLINAILPQRADDLLAHERAGKPPLLDFDYELIADARRLDRPANYALLRITRFCYFAPNWCHPERSRDMPRRRTLFAGSL